MKKIYKIIKHSVNLLSPINISYYEIFIHLFFLHSTGSSNPTGMNSLYMNIYIKFLSTLILPQKVFRIIALFFFLIIILQYPYIFRDPDNCSNNVKKCTLTNTQITKIINLIKFNSTIYNLYIIKLLLVYFFYFIYI
ncbi:CYB protein, partial [Acromyrmex charruanus]